MADSTITLEQVHLTPDQMNKLISESLPGAEKTEATTTEEQVVYERTININGKSLTFQGDTPESVLDQVAAAIAASPVPQAAEPKKEPAKPALTEKEMFDLGVKMQKGDASALKEFLDKSNYVAETLAAQGIDVAKLKKAAEVALDTATANSWEQATAEFLKIPGNDWPGGEQNQELLGMQIARMGLTPSADSIMKAYNHLKSKNMLFPVEGHTPAPKRKASSSSAFGTGSGPIVPQQRTGSGPSISKAAWDRSAQPERDRLYNQFVRSGGDPKKVNWVA